MRNKNCPYRRHCHDAGACEDCDHGKAYENLNKKIEKLKEKNKNLIEEKEALTKILSKRVVDPSDDFFGAVLNCAVRYCIGRQSYMPHLTIGYIRPLIPYLSDKTLDCMERDIRTAGSYGDPVIDEPSWKILHCQISSEIERRKEK